MYGQFHQEDNACTSTKKKLRTYYPNIYIYCATYLAKGVGHRLLWSLTIACSKNFVVRERRENWSRKTKEKKKVKLEADWFCFKRSLTPLSQELPLVTRCCSCLHSIFVVPTVCFASARRRRRAQLALVSPGRSLRRSVGIMCALLLRDLKFIHHTFWPSTYNIITELWRS